MLRPRRLPVRRTGASNPANERGPRVHRWFCGTKPIFDKWMWFVRVMWMAAKGAEVGLVQICARCAQKKAGVVAIRRTAGSSQPRAKGAEKTNLGVVRCTRRAVFAEGSQFCLSGFGLFDLWGIEGGVRTSAFVHFCALCAGRMWWWRWFVERLAVPGPGEGRSKKRTRELCGAQGGRDSRKEANSV